MAYHFHNKGVALYQHRLIDNLLYRITFRKSHAILLSKLLYTDIKKYLPKEKTYFCPNGISSTPENIKIGSQQPAWVLNNDARSKNHRSTITT